jgi:hypothetical protein
MKFLFFFYKIREPEGRTDSAKEIGGEESRGKAWKDDYCTNTLYTSTEMEK